MIFFPTECRDYTSTLMAVLVDSNFSRKRKSQTWDSKGIIIDTKIIFTFSWLSKKDSKPSSFKNVSKFAPISKYNSCNLPMILGFEDFAFV